MLILSTAVQRRPAAEAEAEACAWCGAVHAVDALCQARPRWTRRGFLSLALSGAAVLVSAPLLAQLEPLIAAAPAASTTLSIGEMVAIAWERAVQEQRLENIFTSQWVAQTAREELARRRPRQR